MDLSAGVRREPPIDLEEVGEDEALVARIRAEITANGPIGPGPTTLSRLILVR